MLILKNDADIDQILGALRVALKARIDKGHQIPVAMTNPVINSQPVSWDGEEPTHFITTEVEPGNITFYI